MGHTNYYTNAVIATQCIRTVVTVLEQELDAWNGAKADYEKYIRMAGLAGAAAEDLKKASKRLQELKEYMIEQAKNKPF